MTADFPFKHFVTFKTKRKEKFLFILSLNILFNKLTQITSEADSCMKHQLTTVDDVIDHLGGNTKVQRLLGVGTSQAVHNWRKRGRMPPKTQLVICSELDKSGLDADPALFGMIEKKVAEA